MAMHFNDVGRPQQSGWKFFNRQFVDGNHHPRATCLFCGKVFNSAQYGRDLLPHIAKKCMQVEAQHRREAIELIARADNERRRKRQQIQSPHPVTPRKKTRRSLSTPDKGLPSTPQRAQSLSPMELHQFHLAVAMAFYAACIPFRVIEESSVQRALLFFAPEGTKLPTRKAMSGRLLDEVYERVKDDVSAKIRDVNNVALVTDGWTNPNNAGVMNFILTAPKMNPVFWASIPTEDASHTGQYIASKVSAVIDAVENRFGLGKVIGVVSDNAANMVSSWALLQLSRPHLLFQGCAAHHMNLLLKDLFQKSTFFSGVLSNCVKVSKFVLKRQAFLYSFRIAQQDQDKRRSLSLPVETRWYSHEACVRSVYENRSSLLKVFSNSTLIEVYTTTKGNVEKLHAIQKILEDDTFWAVAEIVLRLTKPISASLATLEKDTTTLSEVHHEFERIAVQKVYRDVVFGLPCDVQDYIRERIDIRHRKATSRASKVAYILDPRLPLWGSVRTSLLASFESVIQLAQILEPNLNESSAREELDTFLAAKLAWQDSDFQLNAKFHPVRWWLYSPYPCLQNIAMRLFTMPSSSASSERSWSIHSLIHTDRRSRLTPARVEKLVFVYSNAGTDKRPCISDVDHDYFLEDSGQQMSE